VIVEVQQNFYGQHIGKTDPYHLTQFFKGLYGLAIIYPIALSLSKLSLLALYWRIFRVTTARLPMQIAAALNIAWGIAAVRGPTSFGRGWHPVDCLRSSWSAFSAVRQCEGSGIPR